MLSPNGVGLSPDEKTVYVADTESSRLFAFDIVSPGVLRTEPFPAPYGGRLVCGLPAFSASTASPSKPRATSASPP